MSESETLSKYQYLDLLLKVVGSVVTVVVLCLLTYQVYTLKEQTDRQSLALEAQSFQAMNQMQFDIDTIMIQNADLRPYFQDHKRLTPDDKNFNRVMLIADMYLDFFDSFDDRYIRTLEGMEDNGKYWILWQKYFQRSFANSPALCERYNDVADEYAKSVSEYTRKGCTTNTSNTAVNPNLAHKGAPVRLAPRVKPAAP